MLVKLDEEVVLELDIAASVAFDWFFLLFLCKSDEISFVLVELLTIDETVSSIKILALVFAGFRVDEDINGSLMAFAGFLLVFSKRVENLSSSSPIVFKFDEMELKFLAGFAVSRPTAEEDILFMILGVLTALFF